MPIYTKKSNGTWSTNVKKVFVKWSDGLWKTATRVLAKTPSGWVQMWPGDAPANNPNDPVNIRLNSYNGTVASSPQYINTVLYGHDNNGASVIGATPITITNRKMQLATDDTGQTDRYQVESSDIYDLTSNSETNVAEKRFYADAWWLFYQLDATNVWATTRIFSANPIKIIKQAPTFNTGSTNFSEGTGASPLFTVNFSFSDTWWKSARLYDSYVRWWENTSKSPGGTILKTTYINDISGLSSTRSGGVYDEYDGSGTTISGSDYYTAVGGVPAGKFIVAEIVLVNSYTDHYNSPVSTYFASGDKPLITAISVTDANGNGVMDNQSSPRIISDGYLYVTATVANAAASTYYLLEPRFYNNQSGAYYRWNSTTLSDYNSWPDDLTPTTNTLSGTTATVTWRIDINADLLYGLGGPTYSGGTSRWSLEFRVSARASSSSTNASASYFDGIATLGASNVYMGGIDLPAMINIAPSSAMTLGVSSTTASANNPVTFNISTNSYPSGYASYPRRYYIDYGDGTNSGWQSFSTGTSNPSVASISKTYTSNGTYTASLKWEPQGYPPRSTNLQTIVVSPALSAPTSVSLASVSRATDTTVTASVNFSGGSGPYYQMYWTTATSAPTTASYDAASTGSPITDTFQPSDGYTYYFYVRSSSTDLGNTTTNGSAAAGTYSNYSNLSPNPSYYFSAPTGGTSSISGSTSVGSTLTLSTNAPTASPAATGQTITWRIANGGTGGSSFVGGTILQNGGTTLVIPSTAAGISTVGYAVRAEVVFNNGVGSQTANSNSVVVTAAAVAPSNTSAPTLSPTTIAVGTQLTAGIGSWSGTTPITYDLRIYRGTQFVATSEQLVASTTTTNASTTLTYTPTQADYDSGQRYFRTFVSATNSAGSTGFIGGQERGPITVPVSPPSNTSQPTVSGNLSVGSTVSFNAGSWSNSPTSYNARLYRGTQFVSSGETLLASTGYSGTYTITQADYNSGQRYLRAFATATNSGGTSSLVAGQEIGPITTGGGGGSAPPAPTISGNNSLAVGGTFTWSSSGATGYYFSVYGPSGSTQYSTYGSIVTTTSFRPGYDATWAGAGNYTIYVVARNSVGDSPAASLTTYMS